MRHIRSSNANRPHHATVTATAATLLLMIGATITATAPPADAAPAASRR
ncbi:hypothetical protein [Streptomyces sp. NPDC056660]